MESARNSRVKTHHELLHSRDFQCFYCLHVRTGTIALGLLHVIMQMALIAVFATALSNPELLNDGSTKTTVVETIDVEQGRFEIHQNTLKQLSTTLPTSRQGLYYELLRSMFFGLASMLLMYGAIWGQPSYLMPFFVIMCFGFANAMLRLVGSFAERQTPQHPGADPSSGFCIMMTVILRAYLLNMVWSCYKFLRLRQELLRNPPSATAGQATMAPRSTQGPVEASVLLPDYEATQKLPYNFYPAPPPPYATAMQMPSVDQVVAPPPSYQDIAGPSQQDEQQQQQPAHLHMQPQPLRVVVLPEAGASGVAGTGAETGSEGMASAAAVPVQPSASEVKEPEGNATPTTAVDDAAGDVKIKVGEDVEVDDSKMNMAAPVSNSASK
ncbi:lysosomal-associated transmembrane protein 4A-like [Tropilaelaps mercedesae]|uniref:Lysosomal-associated transmembrane protein 4A-like n=1 Tax=Tropilaelaps mercedesae TaxID=418985 RepID=A0A1V9XZL3_9ACAR|nr:lysosomal-associated transmembrane protein 4A-like [Tropilaelaps mercedesae]